MSGDDQVAPEASSGQALLYQRCARCLQPFAHDQEERVCPGCVAWLELLHYGPNDGARPPNQRP